MSAHITSAAAAATTQSTLVVNIKDIKGRQLPDVGWRRRSGKFYVKLMVDGELKHQTGISRGNTASWKESFYIETYGSSVLECKVYAQRKVRSDDFMGGTNDRIELLLTEGANGALTRELCKSDAHGNLRSTQTMIEFSIMAITKDAFGRTKPTPSPSEHVQVADDVANTMTGSKKAKADPWDPLIAKIKRFTELADKVAEVHPFAKLAWGILSATHKIIIAQKDRDEGVDRLAEVINDVFSFIKEAEPTKKIESHSRVVTLMAQQAAECGYFIRDYTVNKSFWKRTLKNSFLSDIDGKIKQYEDKFKELKMAFEGRAIIQTGITVSRILDNLDSLNMDLSDIPYAKGVRFDPEKGCLPGTREGIIGEIIQWINNPNDDAASRIFFLTGVAGSGKSAIAHTVAQRFDQLRRLGSSYFYDHADLVNRHPRNLFSTVSLDIADLDSQWKMALCNVVKGNRSLRTTLVATEQFTSFILEPTKALTTVGPIIVVIDALDESGGMESRKALLDILVKRIPDLPSNFRILITARPEKDIVGALNGCPHVFSKHMGTIDEASNEADITLYLESQLSSIHSLESEWPNKQWCCMLIKSSEGLFLWASTACRVIKYGRGGFRPTERLRHFVSSHGMDGLYSAVLSQAFDANDDIAMSRFKLVMGRILATKEPLSISAHSELRSDDEPADLVELIVQQLGLLLSGVNQQHVPVRALHSSFFDFLKDKDRSKSYYVDASQHNQSLTLSSLRVMESGLRFNICGLDTSHLRNADISDLDTRVEGAIPPHLSYGCRFWADHLVATAYDTTILGAISNFLYIHFLYWLEALSLTKNINIALRMLTSILEWNQQNNEDIASFVKDAIKFVAVFGPPIVQSAPHIYLSALPFSPKKSLVAQHYLPQFPKTLQLKIGKADNWERIAGILVGHTESVSSVAFSHTGKHIVSGSSDNTIRIWDAETGNVIVRPLEEHTRYITSVAFSQDDKYIVSGSADQTVCVWNAGSGDVIVGPLEGHRDVVTSVAISYSDKHIVSGSYDMTIRVWDRETGDLAVKPLEGHTSSVNSVAISHDGKCVVSGSADMTIWVWDMKTGDAIVKSLKGHNGPVNSVAISHDGKHTVSGSTDKTIRVWNTNTGDLVVGPLRGHTSSVNSVAISHDGKWIVSGSADHTIRVWDVQTGDFVVGPLEGHTSFVNSVAISHDGRHIVSGSGDRTIRMWDVEIGNSVEGPLEEYTSFVSSVAISHDGRYIVSGSSDRTVCVWDAKSGEMVVGPLEGHTSPVNSVVISHDGKHIVSGSADKTIRVWNTETGHIATGPLEGHTSFVNTVAISHDGNHIASGSADKTIRVWDVETGEMVVGPLQGHTNYVSCVAISHNGKWIVSGSADQTIRVWDVKTGNLVIRPLEGHTNFVTSVAFSHDDKCIVSGAVDKTIRVWDTETGDTIVGPLEGHTDIVKSVAISHHNKHIVSGSYDMTIRVWDAETGNLVVGPLEGHSAAINSVAISHNGKCIVSSSGDRVIRVWDVTIGETTIGLSEEHHGSATSAGFLHDFVPGSSDVPTHVSSVLANESGMEFKDSSRLTGGWIFNSPSTLLFWVPSWNRTGLWWPRNSAIIGGVSTKLDLQNFVHGHLWEKCKA